MSSAITSTKLEQKGQYFGTADAVWVHGYLHFEPGTWKWNEGYLVNLLILKYLCHWFCLNQPQYIRLDSLIVEVFGGFFETFQERSVDHIIYRDYITNRRSLIYCSLARGSTPCTCRPVRSSKSRAESLHALACTWPIYLSLYNRPVKARHFSVVEFAGNSFARGN